MDQCGLDCIGVHGQDGSGLQRTLYSSTTVTGVQGNQTVIGSAQRVLMEVGLMRTVLLLSHLCVSMVSPHILFVSDQII